MQELIELRSEYAKHFLAEDGKRVAELYTYPVHYLDRDTQAWEDSTYLIELDETVSGFVRNMKAAPFRVRFGADQVRFGFAQGKYVNYQFQNANVITPVFEARKANFAGIYTQTDIVYSILSKELKQEIILQDNTAPSSFEVMLGGNVSAELVDNSIRFMDGETVLGGVPAPIVTDAEGNVGAATFSLSDDVLTIVVDSEWLSTAVYPVVIDPTTSIQPDASAGKDAYVDTSTPADNFGGLTYLMCGVNSGSTYMSYLQFDLTSIVTEILEASLYAYFYDSNSAVSSVVNIHKITSSWTEGGITYNSRPAHDATIIDYATLPAVTYGWYDWDISELCEQWRNGAVSNYGVNLDSSSVGYTKFYSSDYAVDTTKRPYLEIVYRQPGPTITAPASTNESSPTNFSNEVSPLITWSFSGYTQKSLQAQVYDSDDNLVYDSGTIESESSIGADSFLIAVSAGLKYGETYGIRVRCQDKADDNWSEWSALHYLQCTMTAPAGLSATADAAHAEIDLAWTAHAGENLAGYRVYRKISTASTYEALKSLVTTNAYSDRIPSSGVTYDYKVAAVATDGYEGPQSSAAQASVTVSTTWIDDVQVPLRSIPVISTPRRASSRIGTDGSYITQDLGLLPRVGMFVIAYSGKALRDSYLALFTAGHIFEYRGPDGETFRGKVIGAIAESRYNLPPSQFVGDLTFDAVEVV